MNSFFFVLATFATASAAEEVGTSRIDVGLLPVVELLGLGVGDLGLVLVVGGDHLDLLGDRLVAVLGLEVVHGHLHGLDGVLARQVGVDARLVVQHGQHDLAVADLPAAAARAAAAARGEQRLAAAAARASAYSTASPHVVRLPCQIPRYSSSSCSRARTSSLSRTRRSGPRPAGSAGRRRWRRSARSARSSRTVTPVLLDLAQDRRRSAATISGDRPSVGSSHSSSRAPVRSTRASASICCSPPDSFVPGERGARAARGTSRRPAPATTGPAPTDGREREVLLDRQAGVDAAVVGDVAEPAPRPPVRRRRPRCRRRGTRPCRVGLRACRPITQRSSVVLPAPLRPTSVTISPSATSQRRPRAAPAPRRTRRTGPSMRQHRRLPGRR